MARHPTSCVAEVQTRSDCREGNANSVRMARGWDNFGG